MIECTCNQCCYARKHPQFGPAPHAATPAPAPAPAIEYRFEIGAEIEVYTNATGRCRWTRAIVQRHEPYLGSPGYYVSYPSTREMHECHGGWIPEHLVRREVAQ